MPVTKTAKRALRSSLKKQQINKLVISKLDIAVRRAKKSKALETIKKAVSLADKASKNKAIHKNKAARIKSALSKLLSKSVTKKSSKPKKVTKKKGKN